MPQPEHHCRVYACKIVVDVAITGVVQPQAQHLLYPGKLRFPHLPPYAVLALLLHRSDAQVADAVISLAAVDVVNSVAWILAIE